MATLFNKGGIKLIECPRDAMQGIHKYIPTDLKIKYLKKLLEVGFDTLDCASFVSAKAIPQMKDSEEVISGIGEFKGNTRLSVIVANRRGAIDAVRFDAIDYLGYPFSVSETFQKRNTNKSIKESMNLVEELIDLADNKDKEMVIYISMGFGNPYGEQWSPQLVVDWVGDLYDAGIRYFSISDTVGVSTPENISVIFKSLNKAFKDAEFGAHFHTKPNEWKEKIDAAFSNGCVRFDGAIRGFGGCPMAEDKLTGNMPTEHLIEYFGSNRLKIDTDAFAHAEQLALKIFS